MSLEEMKALRRSLPSNHCLCFLSEVAIKRGLVALLTVLEGYGAIKVCEEDALRLLLQSLGVWHREVCRSCSPPTGD